ncbi:MAG: outer membrane beta-barrel protein [Gammaproteobacteria bacterium]|nr:outer membrane beta-barrel protein [Gammaproteobacteria bacterium]
MRIRNTLLIFSALAFIPAAFATTTTNTETNNNVAPLFQPGIYVGLQGGFAKADEGNGIHTLFNNYANHNIRQNGFGGRISLGWSISQYFNLETGWVYFASNNYSYPNGGVTQKLRATAGAVDLLGKIILPISKFSKTFDHVSLYVKGGGAWIYRRLSERPNKLHLTQDSITRSTLRPVLGVGITYDFNTNVSMDLGYTRYFGKSLIEQSGSNLTNTSNYIPNGSTAFFGVYYKFTKNPTTMKL